MQWKIFDKDSYTKNRKLVSKRRQQQWRIWIRRWFIDNKDDEIENETRDTIEFSSYVKKIIMKIRRKIEKLNNNTTNIVVSNGENASC